MLHFTVPYTVKHLITLNLKIIKKFRKAHENEINEIKYKFIKSSLMVQQNSAYGKSVTDIFLNNKMSVCSILLSVRYM